MVEQAVYALIKLENIFYICVFAMGQAVGTAAELARQKGVTPNKIDVRALQDKLVSDGAFIGDI